MPAVLDRTGPGNSAGSAVGRSADPAALEAVAWCLWHLACGWRLVPAERDACLQLLKTELPGVRRTDLEAARELIERSAQHRRLPARARDRAGELSLRFALAAEASAKSKSS